MAFCIGGKACSRQKCKQRCKSWFGLQPDLERACMNACKSDSSLTKDVFLCSGKYVDEFILMAAYHSDPCLGNDVTMDDYLDPLDTQAENKERLDSLMPLFLIMAIIIGISIFFLLKRR